MLSARAPRQTTASALPLLVSLLLPLSPLWLLLLPRSLVLPLLPGAALEGGGKLPSPASRIPDASVSG